MRLRQPPLSAKACSTARTRKGSSWAAPTFMLFMLLLKASSASIQHTSAVPSPLLIHTDYHMGIRIYSFPLEATEPHGTAYELRVYMRAICTKGPDVMIKGFAGAFPVTGQAPKGLSLFAPHFQPPTLHRRKLQVLSTTTNQSTTLAWVGPANQGLWAFAGKLRPHGQETLLMEGSSLEHQLSLACQGPLASLGPAIQTVFPRQGLWNVVTTTSANRLPPETLAYLLVLHMKYHERLGMDGTILRCNKGEAQELAALPHIEVLVAKKKLIIWPWVHEHSIGHSPFYWQKPRNQLTLLAAFGHDVKLSFFDLDEYLILTQGGNLNNATCMGKPLLQQHLSAWSFTRYSARSCNRTVDLDCWLDGRPMPSTDGVPLLLERCPCRFHKPILQPQRVRTVSVHYIWPEPGGGVVDVPLQCGFLVHLHALVHNRQHFMPGGVAKDHLAKAVWHLGQSGSAQVSLPGHNASSSWLYDVQKCEALRKAAGKHRDKHFSAC